MNGVAKNIIIMGTFGLNFKLLQLRDEQRFFAICFLGSGYFAQRFNRSFDEEGQKQNFGRFLATPVMFLGDSQKGLSG